MTSHFDITAAAGIAYHEKNPRLAEAEMTSQSNENHITNKVEAKMAPSVD